MTVEIKYAGDANANGNAMPPLPCSQLNGINRKHEPSPVTFRKHDIYTVDKWPIVLLVALVYVYT